jgi:A/G-specific adenine glycosylase
VSHVFTHFELRLDVFHAETDRSTTPHGMFWSMPAEDLPGEALPTVMKKAIEAALPGATKRHRPY